MTSELQKYISKIINNDNRLILIGILSIVIVLWLSLFAIPGLVSSLFNTFLGNIIIFCVIILISIDNFKRGLMIGFAVILLKRAFDFSRAEGFQMYPNSQWDDNIKRKFVVFQQLINPGIVFDLDIIQKQATQEEAEYLLKNGYWNWTEETEQLYIESTNKNPIVRIYAEEQVAQVKTIYNNNAMLNLLANQTKEGQFLINGVEIDIKDNPMDLPNGYGDFAYNSGLEHKKRPIVKCNLERNVLEKTDVTGYEGIFNTDLYKTTEVKLDDIENVIPGFKFKKEKCNPCNNLKNPSCPFELDIKGSEGGTSGVWDYLWNRDT
jgi:hypothetical protein